MQEFINPKSMMTPGIAGSTMMFLVNGIIFAFPELESKTRIIALLLSLLIGSVVFASKDIATAIWTKSVYWIVNSLIIFVVGFGTANFAANSPGQTQPNTSGSLFPSLITSAYAQNDNEGSATASGNSAKPKKAKQAALAEQLELERKKNAELSEQLSKMRTDQNAQASDKPDSAHKVKQESKFFRQW